MKVVNCYVTKTVTYDIEMEAGDEGGEPIPLTYKEHYSGRKVVDDELLDEDGEHIFEEELLEKVRDLVKDHPVDEQA